MTRITMKILLSLILSISALSTTAKDFGEVLDEIVVPLSSPNTVGKLDSSQVYGGIKVTGYSGKEVVVIVHQRQKQYKMVKKNGLTMIPNNSFNLEIEEENNTVYITSRPRGSNPAINLEVKVPQHFDLKINNVNNGDIYVNNVEGEFEISNINGNIILESISGSVIADTVNGKISAVFNNVNKGASMAFSSINHNIDILYPKSTKANLRIKTIKGNIYTGFEMDVQKSKQESDNSFKKGKHKYGIHQWVKGKINGGGPEYSFSSINGDVTIRKQD